MALILLKDKVKKLLTVERFFQLLAVILFCVHMGQLYTFYAIDWRQVLSGLDTILMIILRWSTMVAVGFLIISPFYKGKSFNLYSSIYGLVIGALNLVLYEKNKI